MNNYFSLQSLNIKTTPTYAEGYPGPGLRQAQKCAGLKSVKGTPTA